MENGTKVKLGMARLEGENSVSVLHFSEGMREFIAAESLRPRSIDITN